MTAPVRWSRALLTWTVRGRAAEGTAWGEALLGEFEETGSPAEAVRWALSSLPVAWRERRKLRRAQVSPRVRVTRRILASTALFLAAVFALNWLVVGLVYEPSPAMSPTYMIGSRLIVDKVGFRVLGLDRGDAVVVDLPQDYNGNDDVIRRVVGLPGDRMACNAAGMLTRNGVAVTTPLYQLSGPHTPDLTCPSVTVPRGDVYLLGDNVTVSYDSRIFGPVPASAVKARVLTTIWPGGHLSW